MRDIELVAPTAQLHESFLQNTAEWAGAEQGGASDFQAAQHRRDLDTAAGFAHWVQPLDMLEDPGFAPAAGLVAPSTLWLVRNVQYLGLQTCAMCRAVMSLRSSGGARRFAGPGAPAGASMGCAHVQRREAHLGMHH